MIIRAIIELPHQHGLNKDCHAGFRLAIANGDKLEKLALFKLFKFVDFPITKTEILIFFYLTFQPRGNPDERSYI